MGPRKPEVEYIYLKKLEQQKQRGPDEYTKPVYEGLKRLGNSSLKNGPFSVTFEKQAPHIAPSGDPRDFLSYAPYWWPENPNDAGNVVKYIRKDGKRNPDTGAVKDQAQLESLAENMTYLCLAYFFFEDQKYATHAISLLNTFFISEKTCMNPNMNYAQFVRGCQNKSKMGRGEGVISSRSLCRIVNLLPLLNTSHDFDSSRDQLRIWFERYLEWLLRSPVALEASTSRNNIQTWYTVQVVSIEHYLYPTLPSALNRVVAFFDTVFPNQVDQKTGNQPLESKRTKPFHYLAFNMQAVTFLASIAGSLGVNICAKHNLVHLATRYISTFAAPQPKEDITQGLRCVQIVAREIDDKDGCCNNFIKCALSCSFSEKISGPKNALCALWS
ncbi:putative alginate lyase [Backusella circina FSU 941]|nr:putative alginate lyase [Backusella circina FSU 941]